MTPISSPSVRAAAALCSVTPHPRARGPVPAAGCPAERLPAFGIRAWGARVACGPGGVLPGAGQRGARGCVLVSLRISRPQLTPALRGAPEEPAGTWNQTLEGSSPANRATLPGSGRGCFRGASRKRASRAPGGGRAGWRRAPCRQPRCPSNSAPLRALPSCAEHRVPAAQHSAPGGRERACPSPLLESKYFREAGAPSEEAEAEGGVSAWPSLCRKPAGVPGGRRRYQPADPVARALVHTGALEQLTLTSYLASDL